jgi:ABC-type Zn2+ transport system substrate-binding protein/surface adhesin
VLDPIGYNRKGGWDETYGLKETNVKSKFEAKVVGWKETGIEATIQKNINKQHKQQKLPKQTDKEQKAGKRQRRGPKL